MRWLRHLWPRQLRRRRPRVAAASPTAPPARRATLHRHRWLRPLPWGDAARRRMSYSSHGGKLNYYGGSQQNCVAECNNVAHGKCIMTRKMKPHAKRLERRRPLGFLAAWLAKGIELRNKDEHFYDRSNWPTREERRAARGRLMELDNDDARGLLAAEPAVEDGEATEPDDIELY